MITKQDRERMEGVVDAGNFYREKYRTAKQKIINGLGTGAIYIIGAVGVCLGFIVNSSEDTRIPFYIADKIHRIKNRGRELFR